MNKTFSSFFSLNQWDAIKAFILTVLVILVTALYDTAIANQGGLPTADQWKEIGGLVWKTALAYILKNGLTNSQGKFGTKEPTANQKANNFSS